MPLKSVKIRPGFNKTDTASGAEGQWVDGDFVRFRYGQPQKIGGWKAIGQQTIAGPARAQHTWNDLAGQKYAALGTSKVLLIYYEDAFYDITPLNTATTGYTFTSTTGSATVTVNRTSHNLSVGDYFIFDSVTLPGGGVTGYTTADFETNPFEVLTATANTFTITMPSNETGTGMTAQGSTDIQTYVTIGPINQTYGYGWGTSTWSRLTWGSGSTTSTVILDPGSWSLDNFGERLIATVKDGETFIWDPALSNPLEKRAVLMSGAPTATRLTLVSDRDRHLIHLGTETTLGSPSTQDKMFIRFSNQEDYDVYAPTSVNTAGTFQLDDGTKIVGACKGKDYIMVFTDTATYRMDFVGPPFTFSIRKVASNAGLIGQHAAVYTNGAMWWIGATGGFYVYDGTVKAVPCLVEDFVFTNNVAGDLGLNFNSGEIIYAGINELYSEVNWFYPSANSTVIDRCVTYNYAENVWTTSSLDRTTWEGSTVYAAPFATDYQASEAPTYPTVNGVSNGASILYQHETGTNQVNVDGTQTAISSYIQSGEFEIGAEGEGQYFMSVSRFIPDFKSLSGDAQVTIYVNRYPQSTATSSPLGPFTVTSSTTKIDTRARGRLAAVKIATDGLDESWRYGTFSFDVRPDGRR